METFVDWISNKSPSWAAYHEFISCRLIALDKQPGVRLVRVGENWRRLFANIVLNITGPEATTVCQDDYMCAGLKAVIDDSVHGVQSIWDENLTTED